MPNATVTDTTVTGTTFSGATFSGTDLADGIVQYLKDPRSCGAGSRTLFARLAAESPVIRFGPSLWVVSGFNQVTKLAASPQLRMRLPEQWNQGEPIRPSVAEVLEHLMPIRPPDEHRRLRRLLTSEFRPSSVDQLRSQVETIVDRLFAGPLAAGGCEFISEVCAPLPVYTTAAMLDLPEDDWPLVLGWAKTLNGMIIEEVDHRGRQQRGARPKAASVSASTGTGSGHEMTVEQILQYITALVSRRRAHPGSDLISRLAAQASTIDGRLSQGELVALVTMLFMTGVDTVGSALANALMALTWHPDAWHRVVEDPALAGRAFAEGIRLFTPIPMGARIAETDVDLDGQRIAAGSTVLLMYAAANLDAGAFAEPDRFDLDRDGMGHLAFGHGPHFCLGAALGLIEGETVLRKMAVASPQFSLASEPDSWREQLAFNSVAELHLRLVPARSHWAATTGLAGR